MPWWITRWIQACVSMHVRMGLPTHLHWLISKAARGCTSALCSAELHRHFARITLNSPADILPGSGLHLSQTNPKWLDGRALNSLQCSFAWCPLDFQVNAFDCGSTKETKGPSSLCLNLWSYLGSNRFKSGFVKYPIPEIPYSSAVAQEAKHTKIWYLISPGIWQNTSSALKYSAILYHNTSLTWSSWNANNNK